MGTSSLGDFDSAEHPGKFLDALLAAQRTHVRAARLPVRELDDPVVPLPLARDLRKVRHAQHLTAGAELIELAAHDLGHTPADTRIHLVEYERGPGRAARAHDLDREADARQLPAGRDLRKRTERLPGIEADLKLHALHPGSVRALRCLGLERHFELAV